MDYTGKKVAILGYGLEGKSALRHFTNKGAQVTVLDQNQEIDVPDGVSSHLGPDAFSKLDGFDLLVRSPPVLPVKIHSRVPVTSVINEFLAYTKGTVIGVTGTKGKGTVSSLIFEILKAAGKTAYLGGNIGKPPLDFIEQVADEDYVVLELSNLQLWDVQNSPHIAVVITIFPEHLDWHQGKVEEYVQAKAGITEHQDTDDTVVYNAHNSYATQIADLSPGKKVPYLDKAGFYLESGEFKFKGESVAKTADLQLIGQHNQQNACAAIAATWDIVQDKGVLHRALSQFKGLEHRLELVTEVGGVKYYDDSIGTTPQSTGVAVQAFNQPKVLILGGSDKGADFTGMATQIAGVDIRKIILLGQTAPKIKQSLQESGLSGEKLVDAGNMAEAVKQAAGAAQTGDVVLLSPACASFGMFRDYRDRGKQFKQAVQKLET